MLESKKREDIYMYVFYTLLVSYAWICINDFLIYFYCRNLVKIVKNCENFKINYVYFEKDSLVFDFVNSKGNKDS